MISATLCTFTYITSDSFYDTGNVILTPLRWKLLFTY